MYASLPATATAVHPLYMHRAQDLNPTTQIVHRRIRLGPFVTPNNCQYRTARVRFRYTEYGKLIDTLLLINTYLFMNYKEKESNDIELQTLKLQNLKK